MQVNLSWRELVNCAPRTRGRCFTALDAFAYVQSKGVVSESEYAARNPAEQDVCQTNLDQLTAVKISGYRWLKPGDEEMLKVAVASIGPLSVTIKVVDSFFFYKSGVFYDTNCQRGQQRLINHAVVLVGYGSDILGGDYWIIHNNWGNHWGENGYAKMARNAVLNCEIDSLAIYPIL